MTWKFELLMKPDTEQSITEGPVWDGERLYSLPRGIPQGSPLSPLLANCYLHGFDAELRSAGLRFVRYADDFLVVAKTPFELPEIRELVEGALRGLGLELSAEKTRFTSFDQHFKFLGAEMQGRQIFLPFEKEKFGRTAMDVACIMPPALRSQYRVQMRDLRAGNKLMADLYPPFQPQDPAPSAATPIAPAIPSTMSSTAGGMASLLDSLRRCPETNPK